MRSTTLVLYVLVLVLVIFTGTPHTVSMRMRSTTLVLHVLVLVLVIFTGTPHGPVLPTLSKNFPAGPVEKFGR
jgi:hypothetical protein